ncbi:hypothetical protein ACSSS7_006460 [Eimeria intestinalis]
MTGPVKLKPSQRVSEQLHEPLLSTNGVDSNLGMSLRRDVWLSLAATKAPCAVNFSQPPPSQYASSCTVAEEHLLFELHVRVIKRSVVRINRQKKRVYLSCASKACSCPTAPIATTSLSSGEHVDGSADAGESNERSRTERQTVAGENVDACGHSFLTYDFLVLTDGTHDSALQNLGIRSWGLSSCRRGCSKQHAPLRSESGSRDESVGQECFESGPLRRELRKVNGCISAADPHIYELLGENADELIEVDEFLEEPAMALQCLCLLHKLGIRVHTNLLLHDVVTESQGKLKGVLVVEAAALAREGTEPQKQSSSSASEAENLVSCEVKETFSGHGLAQGQSLTSLRSFEALEENTSASAGLGIPSNSPAKAEPKLLPCRLLLTADRQNIDWDLLQAIQEAGLVYDGRMIVHHDFSTSDASIYAAGSLAEFHRRHRPTRATDLRHQKYSPDEVGFYLSIAIGRRLMPLWLQRTLPPLTGAFFASALLDPRLLRPSRDIVTLHSPVGSKNFKEVHLK